MDGGSGSCSAGSGARGHLPSQHLSTLSEATPTLMALPPQDMSKDRDGGQGRLPGPNHHSQATTDLFFATVD